MKSASWATFRHAVPTSLSIPVTLGALGRRGSTIGQGRYLTSCRNNGSPITANNESNVSVRDLMWSKKWNAHILGNLLVTSVQRCIGSNAKTLGLKNLQFPGMGANGDTPNGARVAHHWTDELLIQQDYSSRTDRSCLARTQHFQSLSRFISHLIGISRPRQSHIKGNPLITGSIDPMDWLPEETNCAGFRDASTVLSEKHRSTLPEVYTNPTFSQPPL